MLESNVVCPEEPLDLSSDSNNDEAQPSLVKYSPSNRVSTGSKMLRSDTKLLSLNGQWAQSHPGRIFFLQLFLSPLLHWLIKLAESNQQLRARRP